MYALSGEIRARRKQAGLTLEELAARVGVTPGALSHVESGRRLPDPRNALAIADALGFEPDEMMRLLDEAHAERRAAQVGRDRAPRATGAPGREWHDSAGVYSSMSLQHAFRSEADVEAAWEADVDPRGAVMRESRSAPRDDHRMLDAAMSAPAPRHRARFADDAADRLRAAEELADDASRAIRTLRGMLDDDDPVLAREARRLLRELDVRVSDD